MAAQRQPLSAPVVRGEIRKFMSLQRETLKNLYAYYGYGIYVGRN